MKNIITQNTCPPIPIRNYDWEAIREDYDLGGIIGHGETEQEAINDLIQQENDL